MFLRIPRWVILRMTSVKQRSCCNGAAAKECASCGRWRGKLLALWVMCGVIGSIWFSDGLQDFGVWRERGRRMLGERARGGVGDKFNLSEAQLQIRINECITKPESEQPPSSFVKLALSVWESLSRCSQVKQERLKERMEFQDQCPVLGSSAADEKIRHFFDREKDIPFMLPPKIRPARNVNTHREHSQGAQAGPERKKNDVRESLERLLSRIFLWVLAGLIIGYNGLFYRSWLKQSSDRQAVSLRLQYQLQNSDSCGNWRKKILSLGVLLGLIVAIWIFFGMNASIVSRRNEMLANMCDERARMLQDQFNVSMNHVNALAILVSAFHHGKHPSAIDQKTFAEYTARTAFERPLTTGVAYALRVPHSKREEFEKLQGWKIKKMETEDQSPVQDEYIPDKLDPSPIQDEYAPVIFSQETLSHIVSIDMMSGKEDRDNILRARKTGKGVLTSPFNLLKSNHLGVVLTFAVYNSNLPPNATPEERINATEGYLGASFDVPSLVEKLLQQLASKQTIIVNVYDTTNSSVPIRMYGPDGKGSNEIHVSNLDFGDPDRKHEMHCSFKKEPPPPWSAITTAIGVTVIVLLVGHIFHAAINRIEKVEDDYHEMRELKVRAEAADVAKSQFLATVSHEIRTPMNGVLGMLQMLMDTELDVTQQDYAMTAQASGKSLIVLINEVLDQAKIESGRIELEAVPFDVREILDNVISLFSDKSQAKGIELAVYMSDQVPEVLIGDPGRFRQIITNLVGNSVKFTEKGHTFVSVHLVEEVKFSCDGDQASKQFLELPHDFKAPLCATLSGFPVVDRWKICENFKKIKCSIEVTDAINLLVVVEDTGIGIPEEAQSRIFMPFMQADSSTSRTYGGTGIDLSISKCLVDLMGGEIGFGSNPGTGSTFAFTAVFKEGRKNAMETKKCHPDMKMSDFQRMKGLVVDGRQVRADVTSYHLQRLGIDVTTANDQSSALQSVIDTCQSSGSTHLDMILVDKDAWGKATGLSFPMLLRELQMKGRIKPQQNLPKLLLLATSLSSVEMEALKSAGFVDCIIKPLRLTMMAASLRKALGIGNNRLREMQPRALRGLLSGKHILVVDDNAVNRKVAAGALKKYGAIVTCADSGNVALQKLRPPHSFDACFMDVQMPEMDGFEATRRIRGMENTVNNLIDSDEVSEGPYRVSGHRWHVPILAMTADVFQATHDECLRCGMDDYVSKPFEEEQLYSAVAHFFGPGESESLL